MTILPKIAFPDMKRWTVDEYHGLRDQGFLRDGDPIELIDGLLVYKDRRDSGNEPMTIGRRHTIAVDVLGLLNQQLIGSGDYMRVHSPIILADKQEPEPDGCLMRGTPLDYRNKDFTAADTLLTIEVADTSLEEVRETKQRIYAEAEIPVYWIVNLRHNKVEVYEQPDAASGEYRTRRDLVPGESATISLPGGKSISVPVNDLVG